MPIYGTSVFHAGYMGTAVVAATGFSYAITANVPVLTATTPVTGIELPIISFNTKPATTLKEIKNSKSGPTPLKEGTFTDDKDISLVVDFDFAQNPHLTANGGLVVGATIPWVCLFLNQTKKSALDGKFWTYSSIVIKSTPVKVEVDGMIGLSFDAEASGPFWPPLT